VVGLLDYTWAQYLTRNGDPQAYYDKAATTARSLGLRGGHGRQRGGLLRRGHERVLGGGWEHLDPDSRSIVDHRER
jgi:hypothetical protein